MRRRGQSEILSLLLVLLVVAGGGYAAWRIFFAAPPLERARKAIRQGKPADAAAILRAAAGMDAKAAPGETEKKPGGEPLDPEIPFLLGSLEDALGRPAEALAAYERCLLRAPDHVEARLAAGRLLLRAGELKRAETEFREILKADAGNARANYELGRLHAVEGSHGVAMDFYRKAAESDPSMLDAHIDLARICGFTGRDEDGIAACEAAIRAKPDHGLAHALLAGFELRRKDYRKARDLCNKAIGFHPNLPEAFLNLGVGCLGTDLLDAAEAQFKKTLELSPEEASAYYYLGLVDLSRKDAKAAAANFGKARDLLKAQKRDRKILVNDRDLATVEKALEAAGKR